MNALVTIFTGGYALLAKLGIMLAVLAGAYFYVHHMHDRIVTLQDTNITLSSTVQDQHATINAITASAAATAQHLMMLNAGMNADARLYQTHVRNLPASAASAAAVNAYCNGIFTDINGTTAVNKSKK